MRRRIVTLTVLILLASTLFAYPRLSTGGAGVAAEQQQRRQRQGRRRATRQTARRPRVDYTDFKHTTKGHDGNCYTCHSPVPSGNWDSARKEPFPDITEYPDHPSCVNCHRQQFFVGAQPTICTVCHKPNFTPRSAPLFAFPNPEPHEATEEYLRQRAPNPKNTASEFRIRFPHDRHVEVIARAQPSPSDGWIFVRASFRQGAAAAPAQTAADKRNSSCAICHSSTPDQNVKASEAFINLPDNLLHSEEKKPDARLWQKGAFKLSPTSHASCFNCHWTDAGIRPQPSQCGECHVLGQRGGFQGADLEAVSKFINPQSVLNQELIKDRVLRREAAKYPHDNENHKDKIGCTSCHFNILDAGDIRSVRGESRTLFVPVITCASSNVKCHTTTTAGSGDINDEIENKKKDPKFACVKCHFANAEKPVPESHNKLVAPAK